MVSQKGKKKNKKIKTASTLLSITIEYMQVIAETQETIKSAAEQINCSHNYRLLEFSLIRKLFYAKQICKLFLVIYSMNELIHGLTWDKPL